MLLIGLFILSLFILNIIKGYPELPIKSANKTEVASLIESANGQIVKIMAEDGYVWYGALFQQGRAIDNFKKKMDQKGWEFLEQNGAGYFFKKGDNTIVVTTKMWTGKYILFKAPGQIIL
jgi:hypothetical protein